MHPAARYAILIIQKGKPKHTVYPQIIMLTVFHSRRLLVVVWRLFSSLGHLINETNKGDNEDTYLDQIRICNIHWHRPPFFRLEG